MTAYTRALNFDASNEWVNAGSASAIDNMTAFTVGVLYRATGTTGGAIIQKRNLTTGWRVLANNNGRLDVSWTRSTTQALTFFSGGVTLGNAWTWLFVTFDQANGTNIFACRRGPYNGTLTTVSPGTNQVGSGTWADDSAINLSVGSSVSGESALRPMDVAFVGLWPSVLSSATIDTYASDMTANGGLTAATDYFLIDSTMGSSATSGKSVFTGTYNGSIALVSGPDFTNSNAPRSMHYSLNGMR